MWILAIILVAVIIIYLFLIAPRMIKRPDRIKLMGVHYAHRGLFDNNSDAPENSLLAFKKAVKSGYGIELDVQLSKDGVPIVFHDASLNRMCGVDGKVWEYDLAELKNMSLAKSGQTIPTFAEALEVIGGKVPIIVEYKLDKVQTKVCELGNELLSRYNGVYCIECFHPYALIWYKKNRPDVIRGQLCMEFWKDKEYRGKPLFLVLSYLLFNVVTRPDFIAYRHSDASNISRRICRVMGALSVTWTIKSREEYETAKKHFDLFIFDSCRL